MITVSDPPTHDPDRLFARARAGDDSAWGELFHACYPKVIRAIRWKLKNPSLRKIYDSTDFASEVMKSLAANAGRLDFESMGALVAFLEKVAEQKVIDEYRRAYSKKRDVSRHSSLDAAGPDAAVPSAAHTASKFAQADETWDRLLAGQDETKRRMIGLKRQGDTIAEIAVKVGWNIRKVQRFFQGLQDAYEQSRGRDD